MKRDDFSVKVKEILAKRVSFLCSNPQCRKPTTGPHSQFNKSLNIGVAAHITAASKGGPRYDSSLDNEARSSEDNGIWLCQNCGKLIDNDEFSFSVQRIKSWKQQAEDYALNRVNGSSIDNFPQPELAKHTPIPRIQNIPYGRARELLINTGWQPKSRHWSTLSEPEVSGGNGPYFIGEGYWEIISACPTGLANCVFSFRDVYGNILFISTIGEVDTEEVTGALVEYWWLGASGSSEKEVQDLGESKAKPIIIDRKLTPPNIIGSISVGTPQEKIKEILGCPDAITMNSWKYRYIDTQVEILFDERGNLQSLLVALIQGNKFYGIDAPFGDYVLGEISVGDLIEMDHDYLIYRDSLRTKEIVVSVRVGPAGAWSECFFGLMHVYSGAGLLAEYDFTWDELKQILISEPKQAIFNWIAIGHYNLEAPYFDWYIK